MGKKKVEVRPTLEKIITAVESIEQKLAPDISISASCDLTVKKYSTDGHGVVFNVDIDKMGITQMNNNSLVLSYDKLPDNFDASKHDLQGELHLIIGVFDK